ncbi:uncharacterized protein JN550_002312 [Neoarthrinium moseri]|uniref:uncharacterized protein n=1 Tax=Neoarthrinium moseri TaxID=1658444 RepID=UPI001FDD654A|nr:uncharacterized protein JN550_002312 [Neoarthrinium moseri]KAI1874883.1 hypothetical protein JN550_002312 [Neoarthrinium moseri]
MLGLYHTSKCDSGTTNIRPHCDPSTIRHGLERAHRRGGIYALGLPVNTFDGDAVDPTGLPVPDKKTARYVNDRTAKAANAQELPVQFALGKFQSVACQEDMPQSLAAPCDLDLFYQAVVVSSNIKPIDLVEQDIGARLVTATSKMHGPK